MRLRRSQHVRYVWQQFNAVLWLLADSNTGRCAAVWLFVALYALSWCVIYMYGCVCRRLRLKLRLHLKLRLRLPKFAVDKSHTCMRQLGFLATHNQQQNGVTTFKPQVRVAINQSIKKIVFFSVPLTWISFKNWMSRASWLAVKNTEVLTMPPCDISVTSSTFELITASISRCMAP